MNDALDHPLFAALIGDLVASREMDEDTRQLVQSTLAEVLRELNQDQKSLAAPLAQTAGDEVQGLFREPAKLMRVVRTITERFEGSGLWIVFGVGWGELSTGSLPGPPRQADNVALLDGPAFHRARSALEEARQRRVWAVFEGFGATGDQVLSSLFELMWVTRNRWATRQKVFVSQMRQRHFQKDVARHLGVQPSVVSEGLKAAHYDAIVRAEDSARLAIDHFVQADLEARMRAARDAR